MGVRHLSTIRLLVIATLLVVVIEPSHGWWHRRRRCRPSRYNHAEAKRMWLYAQASYERNPERLRKWTCKYCRYKELRSGISYGKVYDYRSARALLTYDRNLRGIVVSFRGSANARNWLDNFRFWRSRFRYGSGRVHKGMQATYRRVRNWYVSRVYRLANRLHRRSIDIYFTGHSLGGGLATMAAIDFSRDFRNRRRRHRRAKYFHVRMYNFGSPRVGDSSFVRDYNRHVRRSYRFVNRYDPAPGVPSTWFGYRHVSHKIQLCGRGHSKYLGIYGRR